MLSINCYSCAMGQKSPFISPGAPDLSPIPTYIVPDTEAKTIEVENAVLSLDCKTVFFFLFQNQFSVA